MRSSWWVLCAMVACAPDYSQLDGTGNAEAGRPDAPQESMPDSGGLEVALAGQPDTSGAGGSSGRPEAGATMDLRVEPAAPDAGLAGAGGAGGFGGLGGAGGAGGGPACAGEVAASHPGGPGVPCDYRLPQSGQGQIDFAKVNVRLVGVQGPTDLLYVGNAASCDPLRGGWHYDVDPKDGTPSQVKLCAASCARLKSGAAGTLEIRFGCRTIATTRRSAGRARAC